MASQLAPRQYDLILLGATGYTGTLTAQYLSTHLPPDLKWAIAGRDHTKLSSVLSSISTSSSDRKHPLLPVIEPIPHITPTALSLLASKTRLLITTTGPYHLHGSAVLEACARAGTHYVDCSGETAWVRDATRKFHELAKETGAVCVTQCAMDSAPADLAAWVLAGEVRERFDGGGGEEGVGVKEVVHGVRDFGYGLSGGTLRSLIGVAGTYGIRGMRRAMRPDALCVEGVTPGVAETKAPGWFNVQGSWRSKDVGLLTDSVIGVSDTSLVYRSWSLMDGGGYYGSKFRYFTGMQARNRVTGFAWHWVFVGVQLMLLMPPVRWLLLAVVPKAGEGPGTESKEKPSTLTWKSVAYRDGERTHKVVCNMSYAGSMYSLTAMLLAEAAMVLLRPDRENWAQKIGGGVLTPATLGDQFVERVKAGGLKIEVGLLDE